MSEYFLGIDLGGTKIRAGIVTGAGDVLGQDEVPTTTAARLVDQIVLLRGRLCSAVGIEPGDIFACGVGGAGVADVANGGFAQAPNIEGMHGLAFVPQLELALGIPVAIENDVNVAALGELYYGVGRTASDFVFISVGTGVGMGVIAGGQLLVGARGAAGEIGFLPFGADPLHEHNHRRGALEETLAGDAIVTRYRAATGETVSAHEVFARASAGDGAARESVDLESRWLATAIAAVVAILDPAVVVLGGGIGSRRDLMRSTEAWLTRLNVSVPLMGSELGQLAPVLGAARLAIEFATLTRGSTHE